MAINKRDAILQSDVVLKGTIRNGGRIDVFGYVEGQVNADKLNVHEGGRVFGTARVTDADIHGEMQGEALIRNLINIGAGGTVTGNIRYGRIAMQPGGNLSAELRNIPPDVAGDLEIAVRRGRSVVVTTMDLMAVDPDDSAENLQFSVTQISGGWIAHANAMRDAIDHFTEAEIEAGAVFFVHDGSAEAEAAFDVVVTDHAGATSGVPKTVRVAVIP